MTPLGSSLRARSKAVRRFERRILGRRPPSSAHLCFVVGCERSGTSPLVRVLHSHREIVMGLERYASLYNDMRVRRDPTLIDLDLFSPERFLDFRPEDTHRAPPDFGARHYEVARNRFESGAVARIGDKVLPPNVWIVRTLASKFPESSFVFIYRDQLKVCDSWQRRAGDPDDAWVAGNDFRSGHEHWVDGLDVVDWLEGSIEPERLFVIRCEWFFADDPTYLEALVGFLGLDMDPSMAANHSERSAEFRRREAATVSRLTAEQRAFLHERAHIDRVTHLDAVAAACRDGSPRPAPARFVER